MTPSKNRARTHQLHRLASHAHGQIRGHRQQHPRRLAPHRERFADHPKKYFATTRQPRSHHAKDRIDNQASTSKTITEVQSGLKTGDVNKIKGHASALQNVTRTLTSILPKG
ncbi:MAG: hypothetical protein U0V48_15015 [Anaerolineales bacterium]